MDQKIFDIIDRIANEHSRVDKNRPFGYLTKDDLKNEIWVICLEKLKDFDYSKGNLENFLRVIVHNRIVNLFKKTTKSVSSCCRTCIHNLPNEEINCGLYGLSKELCDKWNKYISNVNARNGLLNAQESNVDQSHKESSIDKMSGEELKKYVEGKIPEEYKRDFAEFSTGGKLSKKKLRKLRMEIQRILYSPQRTLDFVNLTISRKNG